jgi:hypothetical protein
VLVDLLHILLYTRLTFLQTTRGKAIDKGQLYYTRERINVCASLVIMMVIIALLIIPIYLLYSLVKASSKANEQFLDQDGTATCMGILLVFTLLFSAILSVFTRAKRHEILGSAAAYVLRSMSSRTATDALTGIAPYWSSSLGMCHCDQEKCHGSVPFWSIFDALPLCSAIYFVGTSKWCVTSAYHEAHRCREGR